MRRSVILIDEAPGEARGEQNPPKSSPRHRRGHEKCREQPGLHERSTQKPARRDRSLLLRPARRTELPHRFPKRQTAESEREHARTTELEAVRVLRISFDPDEAMVIEVTRSIRREVPESQGSQDPRSEELVCLAPLKHEPMRSLVPEVQQTVKGETEPETERDQPRTHTDPSSKEDRGENEHEVYEDDRERNRIGTTRRLLDG